MRKPHVFALTAFALTALPTIASAQIEPMATEPSTPAASAPVGDGEGFGSADQIFITNEFNLRWTVSTGDKKQNEILFSPTLYYFLSPNFAIGGNVTLLWVKPDGSDASTTFAIGPSVGYNIPLAPALTLFPTARISYENSSATFGTVKVESWRIPLKIYAPVLFHLMPHLSIGLGPFINLGLAQKDGGAKYNEFGIDFILGGYF